MPRISVITTVDNAMHLNEAFASLLAQTTDDWEWLLTTSSGTVVPDSITDDKRVRVVDLPDAVRQNGTAAWKRHAIEQSRGEFLIELDEHDMWLPPTLETILSAMADTDAGMVYTDFALVPVAGPPSGFQPEYGWENSELVVDGLRLRAIGGFDPDAASLHVIDYAPSHGVAWTRNAYYAAGGHQPGTGSADTYDLVVRTYLSGAELHRIAEPLVLSRQHAFRPHDREFEQRMANTYIYQLIAAWAHRNGLSLLDLGAAHNPEPGFQAVDLEDAEINCDIRFGLPVPDDSVGVIRAFDFLEHMNSCPDSTCKHGADGKPRCVVGIINDFYRALAPGGWLISRTPSSEGRGAFQDPTHVSYWNPNSFWYYTRQDQARFIRGIECRFQGTRVWQSFPDEWHRENNILYVHADLVALKGQRQPGLCEI